MDPPASTMSPPPAAAPTSIAAHLRAGSSTISISTLMPGTSPARTTARGRMWDRAAAPAGLPRRGSRPRRARRRGSATRAPARRRALPRRTARRAPGRATATKPSLRRTVTPASPGASWSSWLELDLDLVAARARRRAGQPAGTVGCSAARAPSRSREASQPASSSALAVGARPGGGREPARSRRSAARRAGRIEARRQPLAPRRRAQPGEIDDVRRRRQRLGAREPAPRLDRTVVGVEQHHVDHAAAAPGPPPRGRAGDHSTVGNSETSDGIDDRLEPRQVLGSHVDLDLLAHHAEPVVRRFLVGHHRGRVERRAALLDRAEDRARGVVAADPLEPVGDLALPLAVDDHDQVEHPSRRERRVRRVALAQQLAQRVVDRVRRGVLLSPDVLAQQPPSSSRSPPATVVKERRPLPTGPAGPGRVLRDRRRACPRARPSGSGR